VIVGESGLGKSTLINTLFNTKLYNKKGEIEIPKTVKIQTISGGKQTGALFLS